MFLLVFINSISHVVFVLILINRMIYHRILCFFENRISYVIEEL